MPSSSLCNDLLQFLREVAACAKFGSNFCTFSIRIKLSFSFDICCDNIQITKRTCYFLYISKTPRLCTISGMHLQKGTNLWCKRVNMICRRVNFQCKTCKWQPCTAPLLHCPLASYNLSILIFPFSNVPIIVRVHSETCNLGTLFLKNFILRI